MPCNFGERTRSADASVAAREEKNALDLDPYSLNPKREIPTESFNRAYVFGL